MKPIEAFLKGIKPALFERPTDELLKYPYVEITDLALFFQNDQQKKTFVEQSKGLSFGTREFDRVFGLTLGFPPLAVEYYVATRHSNADIMDFVFNETGIHYAGLRFITSLDHAQESVRWVWNTYKAPDILNLCFVRYDGPKLVAEMIPVAYRDEVELEKQIKVIREQSAVVA